ncbi:hypothetical protein AC1031_019579 [Aphanomyces cochlioides]|nr:hypothetical protein AC1031_019579 [Aphanomyces cochlioides]
MRAWSLLVSVAGLFSARGQTISSDPSSYTCKQFTDPASPFRPFLLELTSKESLNNAARLVPSLWSSCIGSLDPTSVKYAIAKALTTEPSIGAGLAPVALENKRVAACLASLTAASDLLNITEADIASFCTPVAHGLVPCAANYLFPGLFKLITANPCCNVMAQDIQGKYQEAVGAPPLEFAPELLSQAANIVCSIQTPGFFGAANQTCGLTPT